MKNVILAITSAILGLFLATQALAQTPLERGKYLGEGIGGCGNCHTPRGGPLRGQELAGGEAFPGGNAFTAYASNITPDPETGIGNWTDAQIIAAIREGKRPDGSLIGPPMAIDFFRQISDSDVKAIVAWLRTVKPVRNAVQKSQYNIPLGPYAAAGVVADVSPADPVKYGDYLVTVGHCMECHTPMVKGKPDLENRLGAGGRLFPSPRGDNTSANITQDKETGLGNWTDAQIVHGIAKGVRANGAQMRPPMCFGCYDRMTPADLNAMVAYLRTVKPIKNDVLAQ